MQLFKLLLSSLFISSLAACSSIAINTDYDTNIDFTQYKTYNWLPFPKDITINELDRSRYIHAIENNLKKKGFIKVAEQPDFVIANHYGTKSKVNISNWGYSYAPDSYYGGYGYDHAYDYGHGAIFTSGVSVYEYEQGTLILDFVDNKTRKLIWRATAKAMINPASTPKKQTQKINRAVEKILKNFPPQKK